MPDVCKPDRHVIVYFQFFPIRAWYDTVDGADRILHRIQRLLHFDSGMAFCLPAFPLRLLLLNMGAVPEHNAA